MPQFRLGYYAMTLQTFTEMLTGAWKVDCGSVAMVTSLLLRRNATSSVATFMAPTLQLIGVVFNNRKYENLAEEDCKADILCLSLSSFAPAKSEQCEPQLCYKLLVWW